MLPSNPGTMIASLRGEVISVGMDFVIIDCAGVGYNVLVTAQSASRYRVGEEGFIHTMLVVREDAMTLFGFADISERELFNQLQIVSGVGPKLALAVLSVLTPDDIYHAFANADVKTLCTVPGVGKKVAERMLVELKDKLAPYATNMSTVREVVSTPSMYHDVIDALVGLGFAAKDATAAIEELTVDTNRDVSQSALLKQALTLLDRNK